MKGYVVDSQHEVFCYVLADNPSKARYAAFNADEGDGESFRDSWVMEATVRRVPELDGTSFDRTQLMSLGRMFDVCPGCRQMFYPHERDMPIFVSPGGLWYCSEDCWHKAGAPPYAPAESCGTALCLYPE